MERSQRTTARLAILTKRPDQDMRIWDETRALKRVFGDRAKQVPISSTKSMTGHLLGAAGALELAICALAIKHGVIPPTINQFNADPACDLDSAPNKAVERNVDVALSNSFGFGGHNVTLAVRRAA